MTDETHLKFQRIKTRLEQGAKPTETVYNILVKAKNFPITSYYLPFIFSND